MKDPQAYIHQRLCQEHLLKSREQHCSVSHLRDISRTKRFGTVGRLRSAWPTVTGQVRLHGKTPSE